MRLQHFAITLSFVSLALARTIYTVPHSGNGDDDTPALTQAFANNPSLAANSVILFQKGVTYSLLTPVNFPYLQNVTISVQGNLTCGPADIGKTQEIVGDSQIYKDGWISFAGGGSDVSLTGSRDPSSGWLNFYGQQWWDAEVTSNRPSAVTFCGMTRGKITYMKMAQPVAWSMRISGTDIYVGGNKIEAISTSEHTTTNTDAFDVQGNNILLEHNYVFNGDDCLAINDNSTNILFRKNYCRGGHGVSVAALGTPGTIFQDIVIEDVAVVDSFYGARFKSWQGGSGTATNITWRNIRMDNVRYPMLIVQNYTDNHGSFTPSSTSTGSTFINGFTFQNISGTIGNGPGEVITLDLFKGCSREIVFSDIQITSPSNKPVLVKCDPNTALQQMGFECCIDCPFKPTAAGG